MNKIDQLIVRACKSLDPDTRLKSVMRRFYMTGSKTSELLLISLLSDIIDKHHSMAIHKLMNDMLTSMFYMAEATMERKMYCSLKNHIRYSKRDSFDMPSPTKATSCTRPTDIDRWISDTLSIRLGSNK